MTKLFSSYICKSKIICIAYNLATGITTSYSMTMAICKIRNGEWRNGERGMGMNSWECSEDREDSKIIPHFTECYELN